MYLFYTRSNVVVLIQKCIIYLQHWLKFLIYTRSNVVVLIQNCKTCLQHCFTPMHGLSLEDVVVQHLLHVFNATQDGDAGLAVRVAFEQDVLPFLNKNHCYLKLNQRISLIAFQRPYFYSVWERAHSQLGTRYKGQS